jgi:hypothetical protein
MLYYVLLCGFVGGEVDCFWKFQDLVDVYFFICIFLLKRKETVGGVNA